MSTRMPASLEPFAALRFADAAGAWVRTGCGGMVGCRDSVR